MARKQNKSVKTTKKESSIVIKTKKGGKVQKKTPEGKAKKKIESQIKQAVKSQGKQNKSQPKLISPVNIGRRSSRTNSDNTKKPSTLVSQRSNINKVSIPTKAATSPRTGQVKSANKIKSNPVEQLENRKRVSATNSQRSNKNETSLTDQKKPGNKMSLRGKKRSYAELASGDKTEGSNVSKKKKTVDSKDVASRRNRSIKPTVKGSEWRKTILQKKSTGAKQEKTIGKSGKTSLKNKSSAAANKSPANNKKTLPPKSTGTTKAVSKTVTKPSKRPIRGRVLTEKVQKLSPSKNKVKNTTKMTSALSKSPKARSTRKKSAEKPGENENNSSEANTLVTSIVNKFNSSVSNKRKPKDPELQENVLVAQGILHDILHSVGTPDILPKEKKSENNEDVKLATTDSQILPVKMLDQDVVFKSKQTIDVPSKTMKTSVSETKLNHMLIEEQQLVAVNVANETTLESNCNIVNKSNYDSYTNVDLEINKSIEVDKEIISSNKDIGKQNPNNENEMIEEMELRLSDTSATSVNDNDLVPSDNNLTVSSNMEKINRSELLSKSDDALVSVLDSEIKLTEKLMKQENKLSEPLQNEKTKQINGNDDLNDSTGATALFNVIKGSSQMDNMKEESSQQDTKKREQSLLKNDVSLPEISEPITENSNCLKTSVSTFKKSVGENDPGTKETIKPPIKEVKNATSCQRENYNNSTVLDDVKQISNNETEVIINKKEGGREPCIQVNQSEKESSDSIMNLKSTNNKFEEHENVKEILITSLNGKTNKVENCIANEIKSDSDSNFVEHQDPFNDEKNSVSDKKETTMSTVKDNSGITTCHSLSLHKPQSGQICKTNIEESEVMSDNLMTNGVKSIPSEIRSLKSDGTTTPYSTLKTQELTTPGNESLSGISHDNKEIIRNDFTVGKVDTNLLDSNLCLQSDLVKLKENSTMNTIENSKSESTTDKHCLENKEVSSGETRARIETSQNLGNSKTIEFKSQELNVDKPRISEKLPLDSDISSNNVDESNNMSFDAQKVGNDCITVPDKVEPLNSINKNLAQEELGLKKILIPEMTGNDHVASPDSTEIMCDKICSVVGNSKDKIADGSDSSLKHIETEVFREIPSNVSSVATEDGSPTGQHDSTVELNLKSGSSTDLTEEVNLVTLGSTSSSSHIDQISMNEKFSSEDSQVNKKTDSSTNLTDDVKKVSLGSSSSSSHAEQISVGENSHNDNNLSLQTSLKNFESSCPTEEIINSSAEMLANAVENKETGEEFLKMEEGNQEETTQDSIIVDDTDGESMQCNSETQSNRMSVDEDNAGMEVDSEEMAAAVSTCSAVEINMEVS